MPKANKGKGSDSKLRQTVMGEHFSKNNNKPNKKTTQTNSSVAVTVKKKVRGMFSWSSGSYRDTEEYRNHYPGKKDHESLEDNYRFYFNEIPSKPDGDFVDIIHESWFGDYRVLERHHGYIQWLFPIRDTGMNWYAQELQLHEIEKITANEKAKERVLKSYKLMLDFYGMELENETDGKIVRAENWRDRFQHLNRSFHNYLRITRILKSLGELGFEHLKASFVKFILYEGLIECTLPNVLDSCLKFWIGVLREDTEREEVLDYHDKLQIEAMEMEKKPISQPLSLDQAKAATSSKTKQSNLKLNTTQTRARTTQVKDDGESSEDETLEYAMNLVDSDEEDKSGKGNATTQKEHSLSDSDNEKFKTPDADESQESKYWNSKDSLPHGGGGGGGDITKGKDKGDGICDKNGDVGKDKNADLEVTSDEVDDIVTVKNTENEEQNAETMEINEKKEEVSGEHSEDKKESIKETTKLEDSETKVNTEAMEMKEANGGHIEVTDTDKNETIKETTQLEDSKTKENAETMETNEDKKDDGTDKIQDMDVD